VQEQAGGKRAGVDVLIVSLGSTAGLRAADAQLRDALQRAGAGVALVAAARPRQVRTMALTDLGWAHAARVAATEGIERHRPRAIVYSSTTAALLWPRPGAIRFDAPNAGNRPGRHGLWQRPLERRRLAQSPLLLPWSEGALAELPTSAQLDARSLVLHVAVEPSGSPERVRDIAAITYAANPVKKGLDRVLDAWRSVRGERGGAAGELVVAGATDAELCAAGFALAGQAGVRSVGPLPPSAYRALLRRSRVFLCAPRREDYGIAQLEALADGCVLVTTPAPGPYAALPIARDLDSRFVKDDLAEALRAALEQPPHDYATRALAALDGFMGRSLEARVRADLLPRLLV
jgi:hypothetical protein